MVPIRRLLGFAGVLVEQVHEGFVGGLVEVVDLVAAGEEVCDCLLGAVSVKCPDIFRRFKNGEKERHVQQEAAYSQSRWRQYSRYTDGHASPGSPASDWSRIVQQPQDGHHLPRP